VVVPFIQEVAQSVPRESLAAFGRKWQHSWQLAGNPLAAEWQRKGSDLPRLAAVGHRIGNKLATFGRPPVRRRRTVIGI
jgi:hypothetical protein